MKLSIYPLILFVLLLSFGGCTSTRVQTDYVRGTDFRKYQTYAWLPQKDTAKNTLNSSAITLANIRQGVNDEMQARGYKVDTLKPDLLLIVHTMFEKKEYQERTPVYSSYNYYYPGFAPGPYYPYNYSGFNTVPQVMGYNIREIQYIEGSLVIDIIDREKNQLIWRGWSEDTIDRPGEFQEEERDYIRRIFKKFPIPVQEARK